MQKLLVVDDVEINRELLKDIFEGDYEIVEAGDGLEALEIIKDKSDEIAGVLLDIFMPNMNGTDLLEIMKNEGYLQKIPVLMITSEESADKEKACFDIGATDFIRKPFVSILVKTRVNNAVNLYTYKNNLEEKVAEQTEKLVKVNRNIVDILGNLVETRNLESGEHVLRVKNYTKELAYAMRKLYPEKGLTDHLIDVIFDAAALHDIGKIAISDNILLKPGRLTPEEFDIMKTHTTRGSEFIENVENVWDEEYGKISYEIARYHHERYDGRGYPEGLKGDEIPLSAQLVSVADVYDALIHVRCYKEAIPKDKAIEMILNGECGKFSPELMECLKEAYPFEFEQ